MIRSALEFARRRADNVAVALLTALFVSFLIQIGSRYVFNRPLGWTTEASLISWLWLVFWGSGLLVSNREHVRFDLFAAAGAPLTRRLAAFFGCAFIVATVLWSLPASVDFISFMAIEKSGTLRIPLNIVFSVFVVFAVGVIVRQLYYLWKVMRGADPEQMEPAETGDRPLL